MEVAAEAQGQPLSPVKDILMVETEIGRDAHQSCRIGRGLEIELESKRLAFPHCDTAVDGSAVRGSHFDSHIVEHSQRGQTAVADIGLFLAVKVAGTDYVDALEYFFPERDFGGMADLHMPDMILHQRRSAVGRFVPGVLANLVYQFVSTAKSIRLEEIIVLAEIVVSFVSEI